MTSPEHSDVAALSSNSDHLPETNGRITSVQTVWSTHG
jgi:hypothetical protein